MDILVFKMKPWEWNRRVNPHIRESEEILNPDDEYGPPVKNKPAPRWMVDLWKIIMEWTLERGRK